MLLSTRLVPAYCWQARYHPSPNCHSFAPWLLCSTQSLMFSWVAGACTTLVHITGAVMWDSIGSIAVGGLMGATAWFLISRNRQMLIGAPPPSHSTTVFSLSHTLYASPYVPGQVTKKYNLIYSFLICANMNIIDRGSKGLVVLVRSCQYLTR